MELAISCLLGPVLVVPVIYETMNETQDPCVDFYNFACGNYRSHQIVNGKTRPLHLTVTLLDKIRGIMSYYMKSVDQTSPWTPNYIKQMKEMYVACLDPDRNSNSRLDYVRRVIERMGLGALIDSPFRVNWSYEDRATAIYRAGFIGDFVFSMQPGVNYANSTQDVLRISSDPRSDILNPQTDFKIPQVLNYLTQLNVHVSAEEMGEIDRFSAQLKLGKSIPEQFYPTRLGQLKINYPNIKWDQYVVGATLSKVVPRDDLLIHVGSAGLLSNVTTALANIKVLTLHKYLLMMLLRDFSAYKFEAEEPVREIRCVTDLVNHFKVGLGELTYFEQRRTIMQRLGSIIFDELKKYFDSVLVRTTTLDYSTKTKGRQKLAKMRGFFGYSSVQFNDAEMNSYYDGLYLTGLSYYEIIRIMSRRLMEKSIDRYNGDARAKLFDQILAPMDVPQYDKLGNSVKFGLATFHYLLFDPALPLYLNYAALGRIIAHEMMHGFDMDGMFYDGDGNWDNWMSKQSADKLSEIRDCLADDYFNFPLQPATGSVPIAVFNENFVDLGGLEILNEAIQRILPDITPLGLPGFENYTLWQQTFISMAAPICFAGPYTSDGVHAHPIYRNTGLFLQTKHFRDAFNCPPPQKQCPIFNVACTGIGPC